MPLHVLEGLLDALETVDQEAVEEVEEEAIVAMPHAGTTQNIKRKTMDICGTVR